MEIVGLFCYFRLFVLSNTVKEAQTPLRHHANTNNIWTRS